MKKQDDNEREIVREYRSIRKDYEYDPDVFNDEPERTRRVKRIIMLELDPVDRTLMLMYIDCGSLRAMAERFRCSHTTMGTEIRRIKNIILEKYNQETNEDQ